MQYRDMTDGANAVLDALENAQTSERAVMSNLYPDQPQPKNPKSFEMLLRTVLSVIRELPDDMSMVELRLALEEIQERH